MEGIEVRKMARVQYCPRGASLSLLEFNKWRWTLAHHKCCWRNMTNCAQMGKDIAALKDGIDYRI